MQLYYFTNAIIRAYLYMIFYEFYKDGNCLNIGSGASEPIMLDIKQDKVIDCKRTGHGDEYWPSIQKLFPAVIQKQAPKPEETVLKALDADIKNQVHQKFADIEISKEVLMY